MKKVVVIGSGFSSLSSACYLQKQGFQVTVVEKNEQIGGRASVLKEEGFTFDMGPSWYWMPDIFERFFNDFGKTTSDFYTLEKLSPAYRVFFGSNDFIDIEDTPEKISQTFERLDPGSGDRLQSFLQKAEKNYTIAMKDLVYQPGRSLTELMTVDAALRLNLFFKDITKEVAKITKHPHLRSILEFPVLFLGAKPNKTPAFYNFMNWADFGLGTWYPKGGMVEIVKAMKSIASSLGVRFEVNQEVESIEVEQNKAIAVRSSQALFPADFVISGADYAHTEDLLGKYRNYPAASWDKKTFAPSSLLYYFGLNSPVEGVQHHNLFFDTDFTKHAREIYDEKVFPKNPLFYANFPSLSDKSLAPEGMSTAFFLVPTAVDLQDNKAIKEHYFNLIVDRFEKTTGQSLRDKIVYQKSFGIQDFKSRYHSCKGNAYGLANTLFQTSVLRPSIRNKKLSNFYYTGQLTVPGPGVPPALISGKIVSDYLLKKHSS